VPWTGLCWSPHRGEWTLVPSPIFGIDHASQNTKVLLLLHFISHSFHHPIQRYHLCHFLLHHKFGDVDAKMVSNIICTFFDPYSIFQFNFSFWYFKAKISFFKKITQKEQKSVSSSSCCVPLILGGNARAWRLGGCGGKVYKGIKNSKNHLNRTCFFLFPFPSTHSLRFLFYSACLKLKFLIINKKLLPYSSYLTSSHFASQHLLL
jgi:hypothetical protein